MATPAEDPKTALRRTAIGPYGVEEAWTLEQLAGALNT